jgi:hypothetical protein
MRSTRPFAQDYLNAIARAFEKNNASELPLPAVVRANFLTLFKLRVGVKVQAWFRRQTEHGSPELRIGIAFDANDREQNARAAEAFASRHATDLQALGAQPWPSDSDNDRRYRTPIACRIVGVDIDALAARAAQLAHRYVELLTEGKWAEPVARSP